MDISNIFWDPLGDPVSFDTFKLEQLDMLNKVEKYQKNPNQIKIYTFLLFLIPVGLVLIIIFQRDFIGYFEDPRIILLSAMPLFLYVISIKALQEDLLLYLLCKKNGWVYNPKELVSADLFSQAFPMVFDRGRRPTVSNQIWGRIEYKGNVNFWRGYYEYTVGGGRSSHNEKRSVFAINLPEKLPVRFLLIHELSILEHFGDSLKTESEAFNKAFKVQTIEDTSSVKAEVLKILSPSVQVRLVDFNKKYKLDRIYFERDIMFIVFKKDAWKAKYSSFFKKVEIDPRDVTSFNEALREMVELPVEMRQFMD